MAKIYWGKVIFCSSLDQNQQKRISGHIVGVKVKDIFNVQMPPDMVQWRTPLQVFSGKISQTITRTHSKGCRPQDAAF